MLEHQNELGESFKLGIDLKGREEEIVEIAEAELGFVPDPDGLLGYSSWWGSDRVGAFRWSGIHGGKRVLLKAQGVKPSTSEITALKGFERANHGQLVRPPELLASQLWDDRRGFEILVLEYIKRGKLISYPTTAMR